MHAAVVGHFPPPTTSDGGARRGIKPAHVLSRSLPLALGCPASREVKLAGAAPIAPTNDGCTVPREVKFTAAGPHQPIRPFRETARPGHAPPLKPPQRRNLRHGPQDQPARHDLTARPSDAPTKPPFVLCGLSEEITKPAPHDARHGEQSQYIQGSVPHQSGVPAPSRHPTSGSTIHPPQNGRSHLPPHPASATSALTCSLEPAQAAAAAHEPARPRPAAHILPGAPNNTLAQAPAVAPAPSQDERGQGIEGLAPSGHQRCGASRNSVCGGRTEITKEHPNATKMAMKRRPRNHPPQHIGGGPTAPRPNMLPHEAHACAATGGRIRRNAGNGNCLHNSIFTAATDDAGVLSLFEDSYSTQPVYEAVRNLRILSTALARWARSAGSDSAPLSPSEQAHVDAYAANHPLNINTEGATIDTLELNHLPYTTEYFLSSSLPMLPSHWGCDTVIHWLAHELDTPIIVVYRATSATAELAATAYIPGCSNAHTKLRRAKENRPATWEPRPTAHANHRLYRTQSITLRAHLDLVIRTLREENTPPIVLAFVS